MKEKKVCWEGVRNYAARNHLKAMKKGDLAFFYHSNEGLNIVGIAEVIKTFYQDPGTTDPAWVAVDFKPHAVLKKPITLQELKSDSVLKQMKFVQIPRLSVSPVTDPEFELICKIGQKTSIK